MPSRCQRLSIFKESLFLINTSGTRVFVSFCIVFGIFSLNRELIEYVS
ncbi:hypothetical protein GFS31_14440 [Leptolyngbya sp. BL0902]|nr:hypothetical protein GFS31_14440 [Leptolyngbya sp. BL0902]